MGSVSARHVLVVEDNDGDAYIIRRRLVECVEPPLSVTRQSTLHRALTTLSQVEIDAVLLDLNLPDSRGLETLRAVKEAAPDVSGGLVGEEAHASALADELFDKDVVNSPLLWRGVLYVVERHRSRLRQRDLESLIESTPDAIIVATAGSTVRYVNQAGCALFGMSRDALLGASLAFSVRAGQPSEIEVHRGGERLTCEMRVVDLDWAGERAHLAAIRDITERRQAEILRVRSRELELENRQFAAAIRLKSELLANMSHELRTPLNAIIGFSQLLHSGKVDPTSPEHREFLGDILESGRHLLELINNVLELARSDAGKMEFSAEPFDPTTLVREVVAIMRALAAQRGVTMGMDLDESVGVVEIDPGRFRQVLYNYLSNALKFTAEGGHVTIRLRLEHPGAFRLEVTDTGVGIAPEDIERLFVEFQQLDAGLAKRHQGSGLGLALTKKIVEGQGGRVGVRSVPGEGSTFFAVLPRIVAAAHPPPTRLERR